MSIKFRLISSLCTSFLMSMSISFVMTLVNVGVRFPFLSAWIRGWAIGFMVAFPLALILPPNIQQFLRNKGLK